MKFEGAMKIITLEEVDSTNIYAKKNLDAFGDRTVVHALRQTSGRGRLSRKWVDLGAENVFLSIILKPSNSFDEKYSNLTQYLSVVLAELLEEYGVKSQIKWPNDVLVDGKKIAGILSETVMQGNNFKGLILGIGVNLNANQDDVNAIPDKIATALNLEIGYNINANEFIQKLLDKFFANYDNFFEKGFEYIKSDYISRASFLDKEITVQGFKETSTGFAKAVNNAGELVLENNGKEFVLTIGDILC